MMITQVRLEFVKLVTTRMWLGLLALAGGLTALVAVAESARAGGGGIVPSLATPAGQRDILTTTGFGILVAMVFGTTVVTSEFRHRTVTDTYLDQPDRIRVLAAKVITAACGGAVFGLLAAGITSGAAVAFTAAKSYRLAYSAATIARFGAGAVLAAALLAAAGAGLGALVRSQLAAAIIVFAWGFAVEGLLGAVAKPAAPYLPVIAASTMAGATGSATMPPIPAGITPSPFGGAAGLLVGLALVLSAAAAGITIGRDIT
jgi:ABC-type transport system involved in multi-copper enzyme maturation permease subunit